MSISEQAAGIGALADPTRRALYEHVIAQRDAVTRESAAEAIDVPVHVARFQLDRLVELGLLEAEFRRLTGRRGPGAGRPSKLYRRAAGTIAVSLPPRRFDLAGHLLARAIERSADGTPVDVALDEVARAEGDAYGTRLHDDALDDATSESGSAAARTDDADRELDRMGQALAGQGYEPRTAEGRIVLANCPFHDLARAHTDLVCGMNLAYIEGVAGGLGCHRLDAKLQPDAERCCVVIRADAS
ncbi:helix-turn-helix transcriptional regulator [Microbacterium panaciterrae]|uniref:Transcriptional regulator n=1 Tax=Microbacterium panaciterrae TaxID=985759 RepID=A0ABP8P360_9MICO